MRKEATEVFVLELEADIQKQKNGNYLSIGEELDKIYAQLLPIEEDINNPIYSIAFNFWDAWGDASNHNWQYYDPIAKNDWPLLAQEIIESLKTESISTNEIILKKFMPKTKISLLSRLKSWLTKPA